MHNEEDLAILRTACGVKGGNDLIPTQVVHLYNQYKRIRDRCESGRMMPCELYTLVLMAGAGQQENHLPDGVLSWVASGRLTPGKKIKLDWRDSVKEALFEGITADGKVHCTFDGEDKSRDVSPAAVKEIVCQPC